MGRTSSSNIGVVRLCGTMPAVTSKEVAAKEAAKDEIKKSLFIHERNLYFGRCYLVANFDENTKYIFTVKEENKKKFDDKFKMEGKNNYDTIKYYAKDHDVAVHFDVDPLDLEKIKLITETAKFDNIFNINAKDVGFKESFNVCASLLKDKGELHLLLNETQYNKIKDDAKAAGLCSKEVKKVDIVCKGLSLKHVKSPEDAVFYIFHLTPKTTVSNVDMVDGVAVVRSEKVKDELVHDGNDIELDSRSCAVIHQGSNVDMLDGVAVVRSEKVKDELVSNGNDTELDSRSCAVIHQVRKVNLLDAEKVKDQLVLDGNDIGKD